MHSLQANTSVPIKIKITNPIKLGSSDKSIKTYIQEMNNLAKKIIGVGGNYPQGNVVNVSLSDLNGVVEAFKELLEALLNFSSVYNPKTFFVTSLTGNTLKAFLEAYDKLNDQGVRNAVFRKFGVQPLIDFSQNIGQREYVIYGYRDTSLGRYITNLNKMANVFLHDFKTEIIQLESDTERFRILT